MSTLIQSIIVGVLVVVAVVFLVKRLRPTNKGCSSCPYAGACGAASSHSTECSAPDLREKMSRSDKSSE
ncbi:MAG: FeoB-associated Cys-rich membrane protein [Armatimonadetes bacterium]|nr:FeoB-associated Cys-rich membrane protein [Armatimonadota bacterium]